MNKELLNNLFDYKDGNIYCKTKRAFNTIIGSKAGSVDKDGYLRTSINGKSYKNHRIIFCMFHGYMPKEIDHIDRNPNNNRIENLREATSSQNKQNQKLRCDNTSNCKNVSWYKNKEKWNVQLQVKGKRKNFGYFEDLELAELVAIEARNKYHKEFANHG